MWRSSYEIRQAGAMLKALQLASLAWQKSAGWQYVWPSM
jgi:hypothetical protein